MIYRRSVSLFCQKYDEIFFSRLNELYSIAENYQTCEHLHLQESSILAFLHFPVTMKLTRLEQNERL